MTTFINNTNPKALNLDAVKNSQVKVTLGFKCNPGLKLKLAENAVQLGLTLSEYVENLIMNYEKIGIKEKETLIRNNKELLERINFYENDLLKKLLAQYKGESVEFKNLQNETVNLKILVIQDVFTVMINSFKSESK